MEFVGLIVGIVIAALVSGFVIWVVAKLNLGLEVTGFAPAFIAAIVIAVAPTNSSQTRTHWAQTTQRSSL